MWPPACIYLRSICRVHDCSPRHTNVAANDVCFSSLWDGDHDETNPPNDVESRGDESFMPEDKARKTRNQESYLEFVLIVKLFFFGAEIGHTVTSRHYHKKISLHKSVRCGINVLFMKELAFWQAELITCTPRCRMCLPRNRRNMWRPGMTHSSIHQFNSRFTFFLPQDGITEL